jgi:hypothetical protein
MKPLAIAGFALTELGTDQEPRAETDERFLQKHHPSSLHLRRAAGDGSRSHACERILLRQMSSDLPACCGDA